MYGMHKVIAKKKNVSFIKNRLISTVHLEIWKIIAADAASYLLIMLLLLLPSLFISRVDPAKTVRMG